MYLPPIEPVHVLAHTLHATLGSHALIIGAGVSAPAGVPSAWDVQVQLIQKLARQAKLEKVLDNDTAHPWFKDHYGVEGAYETIIEKLAPTVQERQALLRPFFEGDPADPETRPRPTSAHRSIARLALRNAKRAAAADSAYAVAAGTAASSVGSDRAAANDAERYSVVNRARLCPRTRFWTPTMQGPVSS